jgi:hypothetical protein
MNFFLFLTPVEKIHITCAIDFTIENHNVFKNIGTIRRKIKNTSSVSTFTLLELSVLFESLGFYLDDIYDNGEQDPEDDDIVFCGKEENDIVNSCFGIQRKIITSMEASDGLNGNDDDDDGKPGEPILPVPSNGGVSV